MDMRYTLDSNGLPLFFKPGKDPKGAKHLPSSQYKALMANINSCVFKEDKNGDLVAIHPTSKWSRLINGQWVDDIEEMKRTARKKIIAWSKDCIEQLCVLDDPAKQELEAKAIIDNPNADAPFIRAIASKQGVSVMVYAEIILNQISKEWVHRGNIVGTRADLLNHANAISSESDYEKLMNDLDNAQV